MTRIEQEKETVRMMIEIYCRKIEKNESLCPECKEKMERVIEWNGIATGNGGGWFGKSDGGKAI